MTEEGDSNNVVIVDNDEDIATGGEAEAEAESPVTKKKKKKKEKKSSKKDKDKDNNDATKGNGGNGNDDDDNDEEMATESPKTSKKSKKSNGSSDNGVEEIDEISPSSSSGEKSKKKKKKKKDAAAAASDETEELIEALADTDLLSSPVKAIAAKSKSRRKPSSKKNIMAAATSPPASPLRSSGNNSSSSQMKLYTASHSDYDKYSVEYFQATLEEIHSKCERKLKLKTKDKAAFAVMCTNYYDIWTEKQENDRWLTELLEGKNSRINKETANRTIEQLVEAQTKHSTKLESTLSKRKNWCIKSALKVFMGLQEDSLMGVEDKLVKGAIIAQMTPAKLASFASKSTVNKKLLKRLFGDANLMKEMLLHGGAMKYEYGEAIRIYDDCMEVEQQDNGKGKGKKVSSKKSKKTSKDEAEVDVGDDDNNDKWRNVNRKIALACALELASPVYEFDTTTLVDPVERYKHFVEAHKSGELDPTFPFFSVWEMRQIVNCDAPNEQMTWCRKMVMSYVPHLTCLTDVALRYVYMLESDVRIRKPEWTASPRTYPMVLSGGGNDSVNSWFGRFILKSFGLPSWGTKFRRKEGYTRWTPDGWIALNGSNWDDYSWKGKTGKDFRTEAEARNKAPSEEYFKRLVTLQCLADIIDEGDPSSIPEDEKDVLHADRMWRSMSIVSMSLLFQTEAGVKQKFDRKGESLVVTNCEKYLEKFQDDKPDADITYDDDLGIVTIPASRHNGFTDGNIVVVESFTGGKQLNFVAGGIVEYEIPDDVPSETYTLTCEICTVSSKQVSISVKSGDIDEYPVEMMIPYTKGEWQTTDGVEIEIESGTTIRFSRPNGTLGVAIKKFVLSS